jgi:outer membrane protein
MALILLFAMMLAAPSDAQTVLRLTLSEAREAAAQRHPQIRAADLTARAAAQTTDQLLAARYPHVDAALTGAGASPETALAAGSLSNSSVLNRAAAGISVRHVLFDFGRNGNLVERARLQAGAARQTATATRAETILGVDRAYFAVLRAQALLKVAEQAVATRTLVLEQTEALQKSGMKSGLDASIARYDLAESELRLVQSENDLRASSADLSAAIGTNEEHVFELADVPLPVVPIPAEIDTVAWNVRMRPELRALEFERAAALQVVRAEQSLYKPTITAIWSAGWIPVGDIVRNRYNATALNISIPVFDGHLFRARVAEANFKAQALEQQLTDTANRVTRDVRVARLGADTAFRRIGLTADLLARAREALDLAHERYRLGLSSIVELNQTLLSVTDAEMANASAKFEFQIQRSVLDYHSGILH